MTRHKIVKSAFRFFLNRSCISIGKETNMGDKVQQQFAKRGVFWLFTRLIAVCLWISIMFVSVTEKYDFVAITVIAFAAYMMVLLLLPSSLIVKTAVKIKGRDFHVDWWNIDAGCYLMIDVQTGRLAAVWQTSPFRIQIIDAAQLTDAKITFGMEIKNRKTTNKIGVQYWIGEKRYCSYQFHAGRRYVTLESKEGQKLIKQAELLRDKLLMARDVAMHRNVVDGSAKSLTNPLTQEQIVQVNTLLATGNIIGAIKLVREMTGYGLAQAKEMVDNWKSYPQNEN